MFVPDWLSGASYSQAGGKGLLVAQDGEWRKDSSASEAEKLLPLTFCLLLNVEQVEDQAFVVALGSNVEFPVDQASFIAISWTTQASYGREYRRTLK